MIDRKDKGHCPALEELAEYIHNPVFMQFCLEIKNKYQCREKVEFSSCSWEYGWNVKFKKAGKNLCTIYPREGFFTVLVVVGQKESEAVARILHECSPALNDIYRNTEEGNGQKWLMIDLEDNDRMYTDVIRLIDIRSGGNYGL